jgi:stress-induced morphogen
MKEIVIDVSDDGQIQIETKGFIGKSCIEESRFIKDVLGSETARQLTPTYWQKSKIKIKKYLPLCG